MAIKTSVGVSYRQQNIDDQWDAIVVGSGIGGLTTAALLSKYAGKKVLVLERHYTAGGYTHSFHRPGYEWDVGVHYVGQLQDPNSPVRHAFDAITDGSLEWSPMPDVYDRVIIGERTYDFVTGRERFRERMKEYFPREARAIDRYIGAVESAAKWSGLYFAEKAIPRPLAWALGGIMRAPFRRWSDRTTADVLQRITSNAELAGVLTAQWGDYGLPPKQSSFGVHAIIAQHYFEGASYPVGGASRIAAAIAPAIERNGGQVVTSAEVSELLLDRGRAIGVRMSDGRELRAPVVVSDAGARNTFDNLVREPNQGVLHAITELCAVPASMAHLSLYVGVKAAAAELGLNGTNLWVYPGYDHDRNVENFRQNPAGPFPVIYISFPSAKDPDFEQRHPGRATIEVVTPMPYQYFEQWQDTRWKRRGEDYDAFKEQLTQRLKAELERVVPAVAGKIDHAELSTPVTTRHFMNYQRGEAYGLAATPKRFALGCLSAQTPIPGLYLAGQDVTSLGVTGALFGGGVSASAILGRNLVSAISNKATARPVRARAFRAPPRHRLRRTLGPSRTTSSDMALFRTLSAAVFGIDAHLIDVEVDMYPGGNARDFVTVGMPDTAVRESRERIKSALLNSGFGYPNKSVTINLAPANVRKEGAGFDLPMALGILGAMGAVGASDQNLLVGELSLDGSLRPVRGVLSMAVCAQQNGIANLLVPADNAAEAAVTEGVRVFGLRHLAEVVAFLKEPDRFQPASAPQPGAAGPNPSIPDFRDVRGQTTAKRALEVAAAGAHNVLMIGPPGSGKTMLAKRFAGILPPLTFQESLQTTQIHSVAGLLRRDEGLLSYRPFRSPHHTVSDAGLIGGGSGTPRPGEVSLAHHGVLFLDELPEFPRNVLEMLRQPLEERTVTLARATMTLSFPADFMLIAAMNPCPCGGLYGDPSRECRCTGAMVQRYLSKVSGPLLDRIDLHIEVPAVPYKELRGKDNGVGSAEMRERVEAARAIQTRRGFYNAHIPSQMLRKLCALDEAGERTLEMACRKMGLSARAHDRILKVARTIADLGSSDVVTAKHLAEAVQYRSLDRTYWG